MSGTVTVVDLRCCFFLYIFVFVLTVLCKRLNRCCRHGTQTFETASALAKTLSMSARPSDDGIISLIKIVVAIARIVYDTHKKTSDRFQPISVFDLKYGWFEWLFAGASTHREKKTKQQTKNETSPMQINVIKIPRPLRDASHLIFMYLFCMHTVNNSLCMYNRLSKCSEKYTNQISKLTKTMAMATASTTPTTGHRQKCKQRITHSFLDT